jgi:hypothetical protein
MKATISESQLNFFMDKVLKEQTNEFVRWGCNIFDEGSEQREWCENSIQKIKLKTKLITNIIENTKKLFTTESFEDLIQNIKIFNKDDEFFSSRLQQFEDIKSLLCDKAKNSLDEKFISKFSSKSIFIYKKEEKEEYSLINKLNTNYSALSYLLTKFREKENLAGKPFEEIFEKYFGLNEKQKNEGKESVFVNFLIDYFSKKEDADILMRNVLTTIEATTKKGKKSEKEAYNLLVKKYGEENVIDFSGDYSFVDMLGIDFVVRTPTIKKYIPVQVKTGLEYCFGNGDLCENVCMGKDGNGQWVIQLYNGNQSVKTFKVS